MLYSRTIKGFGRSLVHQDSNGRIIGNSKPNPFGGGYVHYDSDGIIAGKSEPSFGGDYANYDVTINIFQN